MLRLKHSMSWLQVTQEELQTAMGFLKEQLGEDELRSLLDRLNDWEAGPQPFNVTKLMEMAQSAETGTTPQLLQQDAKAA